jgi:hypothetical protein
MSDAHGNDDQLRVALAAPPVAPRDPDLFSSNTLFGEPGIYPQGTPMVPAVGEALSDTQAHDALATAGFARAAARFADPALVARVPAPGPRAGLAALTDTLAASVLDAFIAGSTPVQTIGLGAPTSPGRVVGPALDRDDPTMRVVNERYRAEHPVLLGASLTHDLLWNPDGAGQDEECILHALGAMVHLQLIARAPSLAALGTELVRRQNSLAITLLNSRRPGDADISLIAPDGPGTIPGGAPSMQTPDFWSIPFVSTQAPKGSDAQASDAPDALAPVLRAVLRPGVALPTPLRFDARLGALLSADLGRAWLSLDAQRDAARALGSLA